MKNFITKYWVQWVMGTITAGMIALYRKITRKLQKQAADQKALKEGTQSLLRSEIIRCYDMYMERGSISIHGRESMEAMYKAYHQLGGNGTITKLFEELGELPTRTRSREEMRKDEC